MAVAGQADGVGKVGVADGQPADPVGSPDLLRLLADSIPAAVFIKDLQGRYRLVNRAAAAASHRTAADMIGRTDEVGARSARNLPGVHVISPDQLNTYDVLNADDVVFSVEALNAYIESASNKDEKEGVSA